MLIKKLYTTLKEKNKQISQILSGGEKCNNYLKANPLPVLKDWKYQGYI